MNIRFLKSRYGKILALMGLLTVVLVVRLFILTVIEYQSWKDVSENISTRSIYVTAPRGEIYDRYGRLLAGNQQSFTVRMSGSGQTDEKLNKNIVKVLKILKDNGDTVEDNFPITIENGVYSYIYEKKIEEWLLSNGFSSAMSAEEAFSALRGKLGIDPTLNRYDAQLAMQKTYNQYPPISVKEMKFTEGIEKKKFLEAYFGNSSKAQKKTAEEAFVDLRKEMKIDPSLSPQEARDIMIIRNAIKSKGYQKYMPAVVAKNVSKNTVMLIKEEGENLKGVEVVPESTRYYPEGSTAAHVLGYMGKITDEELAKHTSRGYEQNALIGKEGVEGKFETALKGANGEKKVQVNAQGEMQRMISETDAVKGKNVYLTIDLELQKKTEEALEKTIKAMRTKGSITTEYGTSPTAEAAPNAKTGAAVVIEVETGDVLAMASYPTYDPNLLARGINEKDWASLQSTNLRDPLAPAPLYNLATMSAVQPGSTFKPVTATAALECGLDPNAKYKDGGHIMLGNRSFGTVQWNLFRQTMGYLNLAQAIEISCNYYFYDIATGKDWYTGKSLGYKKPITVDTITDYAKQYGLGERTGIELNEAVVPVPTQKRKIQGLQTSLSNEMYAGAEEFFEEKVVKNPDQLKKNIETMKTWITMKNLTWKDLYNDLLPSVGIKESERKKMADRILFDIYPQAEWSTADAFNISIGQGENSYTPLQLANYVATLGDKGVRHNVSVIKSIEGEGNKEKKVVEKVKVSNEKYFDDIIKGMKLVATGKGSVSNTFRGLKFSVAAKTGTAEKSGKVNPPSEVEYIKQNLRRIAPSISWAEVEKEMTRLQKEYPHTYTNADVAVRRAVINLGKVTAAQIDAGKPSYDSFAWVVALAPAENPKIAICVMVPQGSTAANVAPVVKEIMLKYFDLEKEYKDFKIVNVVQ